MSALRKYLARLLKVPMASSDERGDDIAPQATRKTSCFGLAPSIARISLELPTVSVDERDGARREGSSVSEAQSLMCKKNIHHRSTPSGVHAKII